MAIIDRGRVLLNCSPSEAEEQLRGKVWAKSLTKPELVDAQSRFKVISTKLIAGDLSCIFCTILILAKDSSPLSPILKTCSLLDYTQPPKRLMVPRSRFSFHRFFSSRSIYMFFEFLRFELRYWLRGMMVWIFLAFFR